jgi:hypothetical protein
MRSGSLGAALALCLALVAASRIDAHKGITSRYTYNDDVYPILRDKCGRCHTDGGPAPMSLLKYDIESGGAVAWAESIREVLVADAMPPWYADPTGPAVKANHALTPRELDIVVTWATGGTPRGDANKKLVPPAPRPGWSLGSPDLELPMDKPFALAADAAEATAEFVMPTGLTVARWVRAADLLPGTPAMVRQATIATDTGDVLAVWQPGDDVIAAPGGTAFRLNPGATLRLRMHYKKPWQEEQQSRTDRSIVGLYFTDEPLSGKSIEALAIDGGAGTGPATRAFTGTLTAGGRVLALRLSLDQAYATIDVVAHASSGRRVPLLKLRGARPEWPRRYWLVDPVELPAGTTIETTAVPGDPDAGPLLAQTAKPAFGVALDYIRP